MTVENCWVIYGHHKGRFWIGKRVLRRTGTPTSVEFGWWSTMDREEYRGDVVGFYHTHPGMEAYPSNRDDATMTAWADSLGKPLICLIDGRDGLVGWRYDPCPNHHVDPIDVRSIIDVYRFGSIIVGYDHEQGSPSRERLSRGRHRSAAS